jgi:hypothetical protein
MNRYVFVQHQEQSFEGIHALIRRHKPGRGVRAQVALADSEVTHVYALQGETTEELDALTTEAVGNDKVLLSADVCESVPCGRLGDLLGGAGPINLPGLAVYVFLHVELLDVASAEVEVTFELPRIESLMTGVPVDEGRALLVQLAGDELEPLLRDVGAWVVNPGVGCVRAFVGSGTTMVRSPLL